MCLAPFSPTAPIATPQSRSRPNSPSPLHTALLTSPQSRSPPFPTPALLTVSHRFSPLLTAFRHITPAGPRIRADSHPGGRSPQRKALQPPPSSCQEGGGRVAVPPGVFSASGLATAPAPISGRRRQPAPLGRNVRRAASAPLLTGLAHRVPCLAGTPPRRSPGAAERPEKWCCRGCAAAGCCRTSGGK